MINTVIIADDLTGANDTGAILAQNGFKVGTILKTDHMEQFQDYDVLCISINSRGISRDEAYERVQEAAALFPRSDSILYSMRIDSTLRGNVGAEIDGIAGLNPHSGEHGLFGNEELDAIYPAVEELQGKGYKVVGPVGADSVFHLALQGKFNSVLSLYHDQGHIAAKTLDFERTIAVTAGMPILRTSVDHGTAMDIAGTGLASDVSMVEAIRLAARYSPSFVKK